MNQIIEFLKIISPFGAALLAYWLGSRSYFRQKEFELVRGRYLEGGLDRVSAQAEEALSIVTHNFQHAIKVLRVFRDIGPAPAVQMREGFKSLESGALELVAVIRLQELVQDDIFWDVRQLLYSAGQEYHTLLVDDMCGAIKAVAEGKELKVTKAEFLKTYEEKVVSGYLNANRFPLLLSCLHEVASALQAQRLTLKSVREFHKQAVVSDAAKKLREQFGEDIKPLDQELRNMGINPTKAQPEAKPHNTGAAPDANRTIVRSPPVSF